MFTFGDLEEPEHSKCPHMEEARQIVGCSADERSRQHALERECGKSQAAVCKKVDWTPIGRTRIGCLQGRIYA